MLEPGVVQELNTFFHASKVVDQDMASEGTIARRIGNFAKPVEQGRMVSRSDLSISTTTYMTSRWREWTGISDDPLRVVRYEIPWRYDKTSSIRFFATALVIHRCRWSRLTGELVGDRVDHMVNNMHVTRVISFKLTPRFDVGHGVRDNIIAATSAVRSRSRSKTRIFGRDLTASTDRPYL